MHVILDYEVDQKLLAIEGLEDELEVREEAMLAGVSTFKPAELLQSRRDLLSLRKSLFHEREILIKICCKDCPFIPDKAIFHYRDIHDHLTIFFELTESYRDIVTSPMEMYLSMLNNQMTKAANQTNMAVRRLTFIATIFMPLTLLAGIGGVFCKRKSSAGSREHELAHTVGEKRRHDIRHTDFTGTFPRSHLYNAPKGRAS